MSKKTPPGLYLVALPIGNLGDMTFRAIDTLKSADHVWAEDTRNLRKILSYFDIEKSARDIQSCHDHNEREMAQKMVELIAQGASIAYVSDAGMPLISDPGFRLVQAAQKAGQYYTVLPGASAVPSALALSGLPTDRFAFMGFVPNKKAKRRVFFEEIGQLKMTVLAFESARRIHSSLDDALEVLNPKTPTAITREITKAYEEVIHGSLQEVAEKIRGRELKGEIVLAFGENENPEPDDAEIQAALRAAMENMRLKEAVKSVSDGMNLPKNRVYQLALQIKNQD